MATRKEVADHLGISVRTVASRINDGIFPAAKGAGGMDIDACRLAELEYWRGRATGKVSSAKADHDQHKERARLTHHQANIAELEEEQLRALLLNADEVADAWESVFGNFRAKILVLPTKLAAELSGYDQATVFSISERAVHEALNELAAYEIPETKCRDTDSKIAA